MKKYLILLLVVSISCKESSVSKLEEQVEKQEITIDSLINVINVTRRNLIFSNRPCDWHGSWKAEWETPPESYPGVDDMEFYMDGVFAFTSDSLTVTANGYPNCIFNVDTLSHTQLWYVSGDTLFLLNEPNTPGMTYQVASKSEGRIKLQLMDDIFVTLTK